MLKNKKKVILIILAILLVIFIGFTIFLGKQVFDGFTNIVPREETLEEANTYEDKFQDFAKDKQVHYINFPSSKGDHNIPAIHIKKDGNKNIAVLVHGLGGTGKSLPHIMDIFLDLGYDVLAIDQRNSGNNQAPYNTFGFLESYDILDAVNIAKEEIGDDGKLVLWGESYGAGSAAMAAGRDEQNIDYLILESPVADFNDMFDKELKTIEDEQGIPVDYMKFAGGIFTKLKLNYTFKDIDSNQYIKNVSKPVLITNADHDTLTPPYMGESLYKSISHNNKEIFTAKGYKHAEFPRVDSEKYKKIVSDFLNEYK